MANLYTPGQGASVVKPANGIDFQLEELYALLDCRTIEVVPLRESQRLMIIDEEGKLKHDPVTNFQATVIAKFEDAIQDTDIIVGKALICWTRELK